MTIGRSTLVAVSFALLSVLAVACNEPGLAEANSREVAQAKPAASEAQKTRPYAIEAAALPASVNVGDEAELKITVRPEEPWVMKMETPFSIELEAGDSIQLTKSTLGKEEVVDKQAKHKTVATTCKARVAGKHDIGAAMSFFLCTDEVCQRFEDHVKVGFEAN